MILNNNQIYRIENLVSLPVINILNLSNNLIHKLENLDALGTLRELHLDNNFIETLQNFQGLTRLEVLTIRNNKLRSVAEIAKLQWLTRLDVSSNVLTDFDVPGLCPSLEHLDVSLNKMRDIFSVQKATLKLKSLHIQQNPLDKDRDGNINMINFRDLEILTIDSYLERALTGLLEDCKVNGKMIMPGSETQKRRSISPSPEIWQNDMAKMKSLKKGFSLAKEIKKMRKGSTPGKEINKNQNDQSGDFNELQHEIEKISLKDNKDKFLGNGNSQHVKNSQSESIQDPEKNNQQAHKSQEVLEDIQIEMPKEISEYPQVIPDQPKPIETIFGNSQKISTKPESGQFDGKQHSF